VPKPLDDVLVNPESVEKPLVELRRLSFIKLTKSYVHVHPLLQEVVREQNWLERELLCATGACSLLVDCFPFDQNDPDTWNISEELVPHLYAAIRCSVQLLPELAKEEFLPELSHERLCEICIGLHLTGADYSKARGNSCKSAKFLDQASELERRNRSVLYKPPSLLTKFRRWWRRTTAGESILAALITIWVKQN
jgi:hypothetical protein